MGSCRLALRESHPRAGWCLNCPFPWGQLSSEHRKYSASLKEGPDSLVNSRFPQTVFSMFIKDLNSTNNKAQGSEQESQTQKCSDSSAGGEGHGHP